MYCSTAAATVVSILFIMRTSSTAGRNARLCPAQVLDNVWGGVPLWRVYMAISHPRRRYAS